MSDDPIVQLACNAIGYGVMLALEGKSELLAKLQGIPPNGTMYDALLKDAEGFVETRSDIVRDIRSERSGCCCGGCVL